MVRLAQPPLSRSLASKAQAVTSLPGTHRRSGPGLGGFSRTAQRITQGRPPTDAGVPDGP